MTEWKPPAAKMRMRLRRRWRFWYVATVVNLVDPARYSSPATFVGLSKHRVMSRAYHHSEVVGAEWNRVMRGETQ